MKNLLFIFLVIVVISSISCKREYRMNKFKNPPTHISSQFIAESVNVSGIDSRVQQKREDGGDKKNDKRYQTPGLESNPLELENIEKNVPFPDTANFEKLTGLARDNLNFISYSSILLTKNLSNTIDTVRLYFSLEDADITKAVLKGVYKEAFDQILDLNPIDNSVSNLLKAVLDANENEAETNDKMTFKFAHTIDVLDYIIKINSSLNDFSNKAYGQIAYNYDLTKHLANLAPGQIGANNEIIRKAFEIGLFKRLVALKYNHVKGGIMYDRKNSAEYKEINEAKYSNYFVELTKGEGETHNIATHWIGSGGRSMSPSKTETEKIMSHLINDLGVSRTEIFNNWELPVEWYNRSDNSLIMSLH